MKSISIVIPVFNSSTYLPNLYDGLISVLDTCTNNYEIIFIDDNSADKSWTVIEDLAQNDIRVRGIRLSRNYGQHNALLCGIRQACKEIIITMDDDGQNPPEEIPKLIKQFDKGYDLVYGKPNREKQAAFRNIASVVTKITMRTTIGIEHAQDISAYRIFRTSLRDSFANYNSTHVSIDVLLTWATDNISSVIVKLNERSFGKSNYNLVKLVVHTLNYTRSYLNTSDL